MKKPSNFKVKPKILISLLTLLCVVCLILSAIVPSFSKPFKFATGIMVVPLQCKQNRHMVYWQGRINEVSKET